LSANATLVTGATGFIGSLAVAALVADDQRPVVLPIRSSSSVENCRAQIRIGLSDRGVADRLADELMTLVTIVELPDVDRLMDLTAIIDHFYVDEIVHCAGCVDYFDTKELELANILLTTRLLEVARLWCVRRFIYMSTAFCSGYRSMSIPERLHPEPSSAEEPTEYTRTKRIAEWSVAESGVPFVIIRPSIVIGHSVTGVYRGKNYGLYQLWRAVEGLLCREYSPVWYHVAPRIPANFVHADSFQNALIAILSQKRPNDIIHLVSKDETSPTLRELCWKWANVYFPHEIHCFESIDDVPLRSLPIRHRRFLQVVAKNLEIAGHRWKFDDDKLRALRSTGLQFSDATLESIDRCQVQYISNSARIQDHMRIYGDNMGIRPQLIEMKSREVVDRSQL
jgi:nucleoside-diphosphate-sugar epimerase